MRLFIALDVDDAVRAEMRRVRAAIESALQALPARPRVTWVSTDVAHVTLRFIGEVNDEIASRLGDVMRVAIAVSPFDMLWHGVGAFPSPKSPRAIWMGGAGPVDRLNALVAEVEARVGPLVGPGEARPFRAHLTVGRVRDDRPRLDWRSILETISTRPITTGIDHVTLYRSRLSPRGPTYTAVSVAPLV